MTIWTLLQACLLMVNGVAVLNNERFLEPYGLGYSRLGGSNTMDDGAKGLRAQIIGALHAVAYLRVPLIGVNMLVIFLKLLVG